MILSAAIDQTRSRIAPDSSSELPMPDGAQPLDDKTPTIPCENASSMLSLATLSLDSKVPAVTATQPSASAAFAHSVSNQTTVEVALQTENTVESETIAESPKSSPKALPSELLLEIFRYATYLPRSRKLTPLDPFAPRTSTHRFPLYDTTPTMSMRTKYSLVLVCKKWHHIAVELLYEYIVISSLRRARLFSRTLTESSNQNSQNNEKGGRNAPRSSRGYGMWVRHLEVHSSTRTSEKRFFLTEIATVLMKCNNLHSFSGFWVYEVPVGFVDVVCRLNQNTLHGLSWTQPNFRFRFNNAGTLSEPIFNPTSLNVLKHLRVLELTSLPKYSLPFDDFSPADDMTDEILSTRKAPITPSRSNTVLPRVSTLRIAPSPPLLAFASTLSLPSLETFIIDSSVTYAHFAESRTPAISTLASAPLTYTMIQFLAAHGPSITSVEIIPPSNGRRIRDGHNVEEPLDGMKAGYIPSPYPISPGLFLQPGVCPNLQTLVFDCKERSMVYPISFESVVGLSPNQAKGRGSVSPTPTDALDESYPGSSPPEITFDIKLALQISSKPTEVTKPHFALRRVGIRGMDMSRMYPSKPCHSQRHLLSLLSLMESSNDLLPSLTIIQTIDFLFEDVTEVDEKDILIWWTERFDVIGADLLDGKGILWLYDEAPTPIRSQKEGEKPIDKS